MEYNYAQRFESLFGAIDPNMDWDMSHGTRIFGATRAVPSNRNLRTWDRWSSDDEWYYVEQNTISELQSRLPESANNLSHGQAFICKVPDCGFSIIPIYQGGNNHSPVLHMVVDGVYYELWAKGEHLQKTLCDKCGGSGFSTYCNTCKGVGLVSCSTCGGDGYTGYYNNRVCTSCGGSGRRECSTCHGTGNHSGTCSSCRGTGGNWADANTNPKNDSSEKSGYAGTTTGSINSRSVATKGIRGRKLHFEKGELPVGATMTFYTKVNNNEYTYYSTPPTGSNQVAKIKNFTNIPIPSNIQGVTTNGIQHQVMFISCEAGSDNDMNDVVIMFEGEPYVPQPFDITDEETWIEEHITKRYMVEDMGYSDAGTGPSNASTAVKSNYTDIDFNDVVVDFTKTTRTKVKVTTTTLGTTTTQTIEGPYTTRDAKIWALGGTWDFKLFVGNDCVFQKSNANDYINYNTNYKINNVAISAIDASKIYNTTTNTQMKSDGNFNQNIYIGTLTSSAVNNWSEDANNISFEIIDNGVVGKDYGQGIKDELNSKTDVSNVYTLTWPTAGSTPKIVAFDENKPWQRERVHVTKGWFSSSDKAVDSNGNLIDGSAQ